MQLMLEEDVEFAHAYAEQVWGCISRKGSTNKGAVVHDYTKAT